MTRNEAEIAATIKQLQPKLVRVAYRMLGSVHDAQDVVQDALIRWVSVERNDVRDPEAFMHRAVTRLCLDKLRSVQRERKNYEGIWLPDPIVDDEDDEDVTLPLMLALERLSPLERASFLLHNVFGLPFEEVSSILQREITACRQLAARARTHIREARPRFQIEKRRAFEIAEAFYDASRTGNLTALGAPLAADVTLRADGGGKRPTVLEPIIGFEPVMQFFATLARSISKDLSKLVRLGFVNGLPGFVSHESDGEYSTTALDLNEGRIAAIYVVRNPDKLRHLH